jgi:hypothetical protein
MPDMVATSGAIAPIVAYGAALALTLALAAWLTPRAWWRRPNLRALGVLGGGTLAFGLLFCALLAPRWPVSAPSSAPSSALSGAPSSLLAAPPPAAAQPHAGLRYLVVDDLNLRDGNGVRARRVAVLRAGSAVTATGDSDGDWWRVRARIDGQVREGWTSSLWLRRADERRR